MTRRLLALLLLAPAAAVASGHVGDNNTHFRGEAGPYTVQVVVRHPGVVPGLADITVRLEQDGVRSVSVQPVRWDVGLEGSPRPDVARKVASDPRLWSAELWFMTSGSYSVYVYVEGDDGPGTAVVPVSSVATQRLGMSPAFAVVLIALGLFLTVGMVTIVRAAVRESVVPPGVAPDAATRRRGRIATAAAIAAIVLIVTGGRFWWRSEDRLYRSLIFQPIALDTEMRVSDAGRELVIALVDPRWIEQRFTPLVPDHGKLMHMFLVRDSGLAAFAHVHPIAVSRDSFRLALPPLPPGRYRLYADVVHETGLAQTLTDTVELTAPAAVALRPAPGAQVMADPDDAWWTGQPGVVPPRGAATVAAIFEDGAALAWRRGTAPFVAGRELALRFVLLGPDGAPTDFEPYMGMLAHAAVSRDDGNVFVHLHPSGSISMAAQQVLQRAESMAMGEAAIPEATTDTAATGSQPPPPAAALAEAGTDARHPPVGMPDAVSAAPASEITIPYAFPEPGSYRLWVQVKRGGIVRTAAFDITVEPAR